MKLSKNEKLIEKIAILLLKLEPDAREPDRTFSMAANHAAGMAYRVHKGWKEVPGRPYYNERLAHLRKAIKK
jgi:hypothetical protein